MPVSTTRSTATASDETGTAVRSRESGAAVPRVLQVVLQLDPGGTERLVVELATRLRERMAMAVCCLDAPGAWAAQLESAGVPVVALHREPGFRPTLAFKLARLARRLDIDVLHCHHYSPFVYGRLAACLRPACRVIYTEHGRLSDAPPSRKRRVVSPLLAAGVDQLVSVSHDLRSHLLREGMPSRMRVVWNGIDPGEGPSLPRRQAARAALGVDATAFVVASVARLDAVKDLTTLIRAVAEARQSAPALRLILIGDGAERPQLDEVVRRERVSDNVRFMGHRDDSRALLAGADLYANSSTSEGISLTILEAMAAGLPVVATRVGGTPEVVLDGQTGRLVDARDPSAMAAALVEFSLRRAAASAMGAAGRHRVCQHFTIDRMVEQYAAMYGAATGEYPVIR
jgi:glycosyltransferase involved in cell wall biosynthesis